MKEKSKDFWKGYFFGFVTPIIAYLVFITVLIASVAVTIGIH